MWVKAALHCVSPGLSRVWVCGCLPQPAMRRAQYKELIEALGRQLGDRYFQLTEQFHHVFWTGDLNYRMVGLRAADVLDMLERSQVKELYDNYDGMVLDRRDHKLWLGWEEPHMFPNLYPTYKKCVLCPLPQVLDAGSGVERCGGAWCASGMRCDQEFRVRQRLKHTKPQRKAAQPSKPTTSLDGRGRHIASRTRYGVTHSHWLIHSSRHRR